ncbi:MAG: AAA family ATPase [Planctomycetales bacterium]|nr:AAA family ATPase [Planctomycetales bacterium]
MGLRTAKLLQAFFVFMLAWYVFSVLGGWHWLLAMILIMVSLANAVTIWMLRENRNVLARLSCNPIAKKYIEGVCYLTGQQRPMDERPGAAANELELRSSEQFHIAAKRAKQIVRGHDEVIDRSLARIFENMTLRKARRTNKSIGPLASFLLVGNDGIGKRYMARVLSKLLYRSGRVEVFECDRITAESLVGIKGRPGDLLEMIRREPFQMLVFERIERASAEVTNVLSRMLTAGQLTQPGAEAAVSFQHATVVFTTKSSDVIAGMDVQALGRANWQQRAIECLRDERQLDAGLLSAIDEILLSKSPSDEVKAEVISLLLQKECRAHGIELSHVDPIILGTQVLQIDDATGFAHAPNRIKKLLSKPLVAAAAAEHDSLSLRIASDGPQPSLITMNR